MADATQELMLRVRGDNSGADKAIASTKTAVEGLKVSGEKAAGAFKNFSRSLAEARDASAVAASAADSLANIVGKSLMGAFAVGGVKLFTDQINRMGEDVKTVATSAQKAFDDIEKAGQAMSLSEATNQVAQLDALLASTSKKLSDLDRSPFQNFIAGATGARVAMEELVGTSKKLRDMKLAEGLATENANAEFTAGLDEQALQIAKVNAEYEKRSKIAQTFTDKEAYRIYQEASAAQKVRETNAIIDAMAQKAAQEKQKNTHEQIKLNQDLSQQQIKAEEELAEAQQKRFNELYDAEIKSQDLMQKRIDAELKAAQELADKKATLGENVKKAEGATPGGGGGGGGYGGGGYSGAGLTEPGLARPPGQRETSTARGARQQAQMAYEKGRRQEEERYRQNIAQQLKDKGQQSSRNSVDNEIIERGKQRATQEGANRDGLKQYNDALAAAKAEQQSFNDSLKNSAQDFSGLGKGMSELTPEFDKATDSTRNFADEAMKSTGNMVGDFLKTGKESDKLGEEFEKTGEEAKKMAEEFKKAKPPPPQPPGKDKGKGDKDNETLEKIRKLLDDNLKEMRAYAHAT